MTRNPMRWRVMATAWMLALLSLAAFAAEGPPRVAPPVNISTNELTDNEVSIAANPSNPLHLLAAWNAWEERQGVASAYSFDGGRSWSRPALLPGVVTGGPAGDEAGAFQVAGDPVVIFGPDGAAYVVLQAFDVTPPFAASLLVAVSPDGGRTWPRIVAASSGRRGEKERSGRGRSVPDRSAVAVDSDPASPYYGTLYVAFGQEGDEPGMAPYLLASLSPQFGDFARPVAVTSLPAGFTQVAVPVTGPRGALYVVFVAREAGNERSAVFVVESRDAGRTFGAPHRVALFTDPVAGRLPNSSYRASSFAAAAFDSARNRMVVAWNDRLNGVSTMLVSTASLLELDNWPAPARVTPGNTGEQFFPAISASPDGRLDLVFYDRSRDPGNRLNFVTYAWSADGGRDWETLNVTRAPFDGDLQGTPGGRRFIGDYIGVASTRGAAHIAWVGNGKDTPCACNQDIFTTTISHE